MEDALRRELEMLQARNERLQFLAEFSHELLTVTTHQEFVRRVFEPLSRHLELEVYLNFVVSEDGSHLELDSFSGLPEKMAEKLRRLDFGVAVCGTVAAEACPIVAEGVQERSDEMTKLIRELGVNAYTCHPLIAEDRVIGTLSFGSRVRDRFERDEIELLRAACDQVAVAIERTRLLEALQGQTERLKEADAKKDQFLAMLAHELRNPMAPILTASRILEDGDGVAAERARTIIQRQAQHMSRLVDDLLDVSRITRGRILIRKERVDLSQVLRSAAQVCASMVEDRAQRLDVETDGPVPVTGDAARLEQVAANLLVNANKYTPRGGRIRAVVRREGQEGVLTVSDTGVGISPGELDRIFEMFYRREDDAGQSGGGLGVGLTLVQSLVELHRGRVTARSEGLDRGSEFEVRIPMSLERESSPGLGEASSAEELTAQTILLVEDNQDSAEMLRILLELRGARVLVAHEGPGALELARRERPAVAIIDLGLPGISGIEVGQRLRAELGDISLLALSGYAAEGDRARTRAAGFQAHLAKPIDVEALERAVSDAQAARSGAPTGR